MFDHLFLFVLVRKESARDFSEYEETEVEGTEEEDFRVEESPASVLGVVADEFDEVMVEGLVRRVFEARVHRRQDGDDQVEHEHEVEEQEEQVDEFADEQGLHEDVFFDRHHDVAKRRDIDLYE